MERNWPGDVLIVICSRARGKFLEIDVNGFPCTISNGVDAFEKSVELCSKLFGFSFRHGIDGGINAFVDFVNTAHLACTVQVVFNLQPCKNERENERKKNIDSKNTKTFVML